MEQKDPQSQWMSIGQAAKYLGVSRDTLRRWEEKGKIKAIRSPTDRRYYTKTILDASMDAKNVKEVNQSITKPTLVKTKLKTKQLIIIGILSFAAAVALALVVQLINPIAALLINLF